MQRPATPQPRLLNRSCSPHNSLGSGSEATDSAGMGALNQELVNTHVRNVIKPVAERDAPAYAFVVNQLRNAESGKPRVIACWLRALGNCASSLDLKNAREILAEVFRMDFTVNPEVQNAYMDLVTELCTSHSTYIQTIFHSLFSRLCPKEQSESVPLSTTPTLFTSSASSGHTTPTGAYEKSEAVRGAIIPTVLDIVDLVPMSTTVLASTVTKMYPHKVHPVDMHRAWASTALDFARSVPSIRDPLVAAVVRSVVQMDSDLKISGSNSNDDEQFGSIAVSAQAAAMDADSLQNKVLADKIDTIMCLLLSYIEDQIDETDTEHFNTILSCFVQYVLPTNRPKVAQFLLFRACAICTKFAEAFLECMLEKARDEASPTSVRVAACSYIASFLARSKAVTPKTVENYIREMLQLSGKYSASFIESIKATNVSNDSKETSKTCKSSSPLTVSFQETIVDPTAHPLFYSAVQSSMYALCYAYREAAKTNVNGHNSGEEGDDNDKNGTKISGKWLESLGFIRVLSSPLNPLRVCDSAIVEEFRKYWVTVTGSDSSLKSAVSLAESNRSIMLLQGAYDGRFEKSPFIPFDPCPLRESAKHIDPVYKFWSISDGRAVSRGSATTSGTVHSSGIKYEIKNETKRGIANVSLKRPLSLRDADSYELMDDDDSNSENKMENFSHPLRKVAKVIKIETICNDESPTIGESGNQKGDNEENGFDNNGDSDDDDNSDSDDDDDDESDDDNDRGKAGIEMGKANFNFDLY